MKRRSLFCPSVLVLSMLIAPAALATEITVGSFVQDLARTHDFRLPADLDLSRNLTEADVVRIAGAAGLRVRTSRPGASFSAEQAESLLLSFRADLGGGSANAETRGSGSDTARHRGGRDGKHGKGKGKKPKTPTDPKD